MKKDYRVPSIKENVLWNTCGSLLYFGTQWLITVLLFRYMGSSETGVFQLCMTIASVFVSIAMFGMRNYQVSDVNKEFSDSEYKCSRLVTVLVTLLICILFVAVNGYKAHKSICIIFYMIFKLSEAVVDVYHGIDQRHMKMDYVGISFALRGVVTFVVFMVICKYWGNLEMAIAGMAAAAYIVIIFFDIPMCRKIAHKEKGADYKRIFQLFIICIPLVGYYFFINGTASVSKYILEKQMGSDVFGYYTSVATPAVIVQTAATFIYAPFVTELSNKYADKDIKGYKKVIKTVSLIITFICISALVVGKLVGEYFLVLILGEDIRKWSYLFVPIILSACVIAYSWFISTVLIVIRRLKILLVITALGFAISALISFPLISLSGSNGTTYAVIISQLVMILGFAGVIIYDLKKNC